MNTQTVHVVQGRLALHEAWEYAQVTALDAGELIERCAPDGIRAALSAEIHQATAECIDLARNGALSAVAEHPDGVRRIARLIERCWYANVQWGDGPALFAKIDALRAMALAVSETLGPHRLTPETLTTQATANCDAVEIASLIVHGRAANARRTLTVIKALGESGTRVSWTGPASLRPDWTREYAHSVEPVADGPTEPTIGASCATPYHEAQEAVRWVAQNAAGNARSGTFAIAATHVEAYESYIRTAAQRAGVPLHLTEGKRTLDTPHGQAVDAFAAVVAHGPDNGRARRLAGALVRDENEVRAAFDSAGETPNDQAKALLDPGQATLWNRLNEAPGTHGTPRQRLAHMQEEPERETLQRVAFGPLREIADARRANLWCLGMNAAWWPTPWSEDDTVLNEEEAEAIGLYATSPRARDIAHAHAARAGTSQALVTSHPRSDEEGRSLIRSMIDPASEGATQWRARAMAQQPTTPSPDTVLRRAQAAQCFAAWHSNSLGAHDGMIRPDHRAISAVLDRPQSASSLRRLLRNPLGYVWRYALRWDEPKDQELELGLDALGWGDLVHQMIEEATRLRAASPHNDTEAAIAEAKEKLSNRWNTGGRSISTTLWKRTLERAGQMTAWALRDDTYGTETVATTEAEVAFGRRPRQRSDRQLEALRLPRSAMQITGYIDRVDYDGDGHALRVIDYKTGRYRCGPRTLINGGRELQRCLYAAALHAATGQPQAPKAYLAYVRDQRTSALDKVADALDAIDAGAQAASAALRAGRCLPGPDATLAYDPMCFALPAHAEEGYRSRKETLIAEALGGLSKLWEMP